MTSSTSSLATVPLLGMPLAVVDAPGLLQYMFATLKEGRGGWLITANLDFMRRYRIDPEMRALYSGADVCVADGMPLVWAAKLQGTALPERIAGSSLVLDLVARAAQEGRRVYLLGGEPGAAEGAVQLFRGQHPQLQIAHSAPMVASPPTEAQLVSLVPELKAFAPDLLLVGLGSPKQEQLIAALRPHFPATWMAGVGVSFSFAAGSKQRAPEWMQRAGLEWVHRMAQEPGRLARRYLIEDLPFAAVLFGTALRARGKHRE